MLTASLSLDAFTLTCARQRLRCQLPGNLSEAGGLSFARRFALAPVTAPMLTPVTMPLAPPIMTLMPTLRRLGCRAYADAPDRSNGLANASAAAAPLPPLPALQRPRRCHSRRLR